jgi:type IV pilus assembly protein PilV
MGPPVWQVNRGFTLIEVMIAMLALLVGLLACFAGVMAAADYNLGNALRNEAIKIAQEQLENLRVGRYDQIAAGSTQVQRQMRKALYAFQVTTTVTVSDSITQIGVTVQWTFKNRPRTYATETLIRQRVS